MIDLDGKAPLIATVRDCVIRCGLFKPFAKEQARVLLTQPVHREGQKTGPGCSIPMKSRNWRTSWCAEG